MRMFQEQIEFQLFPYVSRWKDPQINATALKRERLLYRQFYLRPRPVFRQVLSALRFPARSLRLLLLFFRFILVTAKGKDRHDLF